MRKSVVTIVVLMLLIASITLMVACNPTQAEGTYTCGTQTIKISGLTESEGYAEFINVQTLTGTYTSSSPILFDIYASNGDIYSVKITINGKTYDERFNAKKGTFTFNGYTFTR